MSVTVTNDNVFHLQTKNTSYIMTVVDGRYLAHVYWGKIMPTPDMDNAQINRWIVFSPWNGHRPNKLPPDRFRETECPTTSAIGLRATSASIKDGGNAMVVRFLP